MKEKSIGNPIIKLDEFNADSNYLRAIVVTTVAFVCMIGLAGIGAYSTSDLSPRQKRTLLLEGGIVETATVWLYAVTGFALLAIGVHQWIRRRRSEQDGNVSATRMGPMHPWLLAGLVFCFAARELDFHTQFTSMSVLKTRYFISSEVRLFEKLVVFVILATIVLAVVRLFAIYHQKILSRFKKGLLAGVLPVLAVMLIAFSKGLDSGVTILQKSGVLQLGSWQKEGIAATEEMSELLIPVLFLSMFIIAIVPQFAGRKSGASVENRGDSQRPNDFKKAA